MTDRPRRDEVFDQDAAEGPTTGGRGYDALLAAHGADQPGAADGAEGGDDDGHHHDDHGYHDEHHDHHDVATPHRKRRGMAIIGAAILLLLGGLVLAFQFIAPIVGGLMESKDFDGPGTGQANVVVHQGDTGGVIAQTLVDAGVVKTTKAFTSALEENQGDYIQPGTYTLAKQMKASDALSALRSGQARNETTVTIREGLRAAEVYELLSKATGVPVKDYQAAAKKPKDLGLPAAAGGSVEGYLFPATYSFGPKASAADQLEKLVSQAVSQYTSLGVPEASMKEIVTIASIVESEARNPADRPKVAAVIRNRLKAKMPLQLDSTVSYGVGKRTVTTTDADRHNDNPYNTYMHPGLPKGPIDNPGADAVKAALHPAAGTWKFFVTIDPVSGETAFADTLEQHAVNVKKFQAWCQKNPGKCN